MDQTLHTGTTTVGITVKDAVIMATESMHNTGLIHIMLTKNPTIKPPRSPIPSQFHMACHQP